MVRNEEVLCLNCLLNLSKTLNIYDRDNELVDKVSIYFPIKNAYSFLNYQNGSLSRGLIHQFKYKENINIGKYLTSLFIKQIEKTIWIEEIDIIIPVPLHWARLFKRGYNQSEIIARQIGKYFNIPVRTNILKRKKYNPTQLYKNKERRWENVKNIFLIKKIEEIKGKHILLIDDIITTGATMNACIKTMSQIENIKISVLCLAQRN
jgi:ComF family protein